VVHRCRGANHLIDRAAAARRQRSADDRHDSGAGGDDVAPRAGDGERDVPDAGRRRRGRDRFDAEASDAQHREAGGRIPAGELGVERLTVVAPNARLKASRYLLFFVAASLLHAQAAPPDTILVNGHVITVDARFSIAQAIAIKDGRFTAVGTDADIRKLAGPNTTTIDLHGQTV